MLNSTFDSISKFTKIGQLLDKAFSTRADDFKPLLEVSNPDPLYASEIAHTKRFLECWCADRDMRAAMDTSEEARFIQLYQLQADPEEIRFLWDNAYAKEQLKSPGWKAPLAVQRYKTWINEKLLHRERLRVEDISPSDPRHLAWRSRQVNRIFGHLGKKPWESIVHAPFSTELSDGCSVGCWFCGVSAEKRKQDWLYTAENQKFWQDILSVLSKKIGPAAMYGFCYWATDPLDNPDYERFCLDYANKLGKWPQTTTAQAHKHIERVRKLLIESRQHGCLINRFSVLSLGIFRKLIAAFTAEELLYTELITQNMEANSMQSNSGRARGSERIKIKASQTNGVKDGWENVPGTIACVSGFLLNMVQKRVRLVTPVPCTDRWPDGYYVYADEVFDSPESFGKIIEKMMARYMPISLRCSDVVRFRKDLRFEEIENGFKLTCWGAITTYKDNATQLTIARIVARGTSTVAEIAVEAEKASGALFEHTMFFLNSLFDKGLLDEEPQNPDHLSRVPIKNSLNTANSAN